LVNTRVDYWCW